MREAVEVVRKRPGRRPATPVEQGEDASGRPSTPDVVGRSDDMLARHRAERPPTAATPGSELTNTPGRVSGWPGRSPPPRAGTGTAGFKAMLRTHVSEKAVRGIMTEDAPTAHVPR